MLAERGCVMLQVLFVVRCLVLACLWKLAGSTSLLGVVYYTSSVLQHCFFRYYYICKSIKRKIIKVIKKYFFCKLNIKIATSNHDKLRQNACDKNFFFHFSFFSPVR